MSLSAEQIRMARAALKLTMRDLATRAGIDKSTLVRIEAGYGAHAFTLRQLREVLETAGVIFLEADGNAGPGVRIKLGVKIPQPAHAEGTAAGEAGDGGMKAAAWDEDEEDADLDALLGEEPELNPDMAEMWRDDPELWARLSEGGRETLSRSMFGDTRAAGEGYFRTETRGQLAERI